MSRSAKMGFRSMRNGVRHGTTNPGPIRPPMPESPTRHRGAVQPTGRAAALGLGPAGEGPVWPPDSTSFSWRKRLGWPTRPSLQAWNAQRDGGPPLPLRRPGVRPAGVAPLGHLGVVQMSNNEIVLVRREPGADGSLAVTVTDAGLSAVERLAANGNADATIASALGINRKTFASCSERTGTSGS